METYGSPKATGPTRRAALPENWRPYVWRGEPGWRPENVVITEAAPRPKPQREDLGAAPSERFLCGAPTAWEGWTCKKPVKVEGGRCGWHAEA